VSSNVITVTVFDTLIAGEIGADQAICRDSIPALLTSVISGSGGAAGATYQWQLSTDAGATFTDITGADSATFQAQALTQTTQFRRNFVSSCGTVSSNVITVTVFDTLIAGEIGTDQTICRDSIPAVFTSVVSGSGGAAGATYQWQMSIDAGATFTDITGADSATLQAGALTQTTQFRRNFVSSCGTVSSNVITVTVFDTLIAGEIGTDQTICRDSIPVAFTSVVSGGGGAAGATYQWQLSIDAGATFTDITGADSATLQAGALTQTTQFRRNFVSDCGVVSSNVIVVTVLATVTPGVIGANQSICHGDTPAEFTNVTSATGGNPAVDVYQWQMSTDTIIWNNISSANSPTFQAGALTTTTHFRRMHLNACGDTASNMITVTVHALPQAVTVNATPECGFTILTASATLATGDTIFWQGTTNEGTSTARPSILDTVTADGTYFYRVRSAEGCWGTQGSYIVTIVPPHTLELTSAVGTDFQNVGVDSTLVNIVYTLGGSADSVTIAWTGTADADTPPEGITVSFAMPTLTISGTPTTVGIYTYIITTVGNLLCTPVSDTGTIMVGMRGCNLNTPGWGDTLGTISWGTVANTDIETGTTFIPGTGNRPPQVWSGAVFATACAKGNDTDNDEFDGGTAGNFNADCRQTLASFNNRSTSVTGDFFSWCAVMRFADQLCPYPWRVPTELDFVDLDMNMGGTGQNRISAQEVSDLYVGNLGNANAPQTGGIWGGTRWTGSSANLNEDATRYWTSVTYSDEHAHALALNLPGSINLNSLAMNNLRLKSLGRVLRCVRDYDCDILHLVSDSGTADQFVCSGQDILPITFDFVAGTLGSATAAALGIRWYSVSADATDTTLLASAPTGLAFDAATITISGTPTQAGSFIFEIFTTDHAATCDTARVTGSINVALLPCPGCNNTPLPFELGTPYFATNQTWQVGEQLWSDAVRAPGCELRDTAFDGGTDPPGFNADCRSSIDNPNFSGHFFTWCMVMRFADVLCPAPWRVPTTEDFAALHQSFGFSLPALGSGFTSTRIQETYMGTTPDPNGGIWGGARFSGHATNQTAMGSNYWSSTNINQAQARLLHFAENHGGATLVVFPQLNGPKSMGFPLRCIRSTEDPITCDTIQLTSHDTTANQTLCGTFTIVDIVYDAEGITSAGISWFVVAGDDTTQVAPPAGITFAITPTELTISGTFTDTTSAVFIYQVHAMTDTSCLTASGRIARLTVEECDILALNCNLDTPGWGDTLGTISWGTIGNTDIETGTSLVRGTGGRPTQVWSGAVFATACQKTTFDGGTTGDFNADCRSAHTGLTGDFFSWCAVMRFGDSLCPYPWRVPTTEDFAILHQNLGFTLGDMVEHGNAEHYMPATGTGSSPEVGGIWGGARFTGISSQPTSDNSWYWSSTEMTAVNAHRLLFNATNVWPTAWNNKSAGLALRCIRKYDCDILNLTSAAGTTNQFVCNDQDIVPITFELDTTTLGAATALGIRWFSVDGTDTTSIAMPTGFDFDAATFTISGSTTEVGHFIFEVFTTDPAATCDTVSVRGTINVALLPCPNCNNALPGWGADGLGTISWGSVSNTVIDSGATMVEGFGGRPTQIWSGAVFATACAKGNDTNNNEFDSSSAGGFNADCRQTLFSFTDRSTSPTGDLFSWCAVMRFADVLCPDGWRVPTLEDFEILHFNLGYTTISGVTPIPLIADTYFGTTGTSTAPEVGGIWGGVRFTGSTVILENESTRYWSSTVSRTLATFAYTVLLSPNSVWVGSHFSKGPGFVLRCVRDYECDMLYFTVDSATANQTVGSGQIIAPVTVDFAPGTLGTATTTNIRWQRIDTLANSDLDTVDVAMPTGLNYNGTTHTLSGATAIPGRYIFEIFTTNHDTACNEATIRGTLTVTTIPTTNCNSSTPGWGNSFGTITWGDINNTNIEAGTSMVEGTGGRPTQIWSGAVFAEACDKGNDNTIANDAFNAGTLGNLNADCRRSLGSFNDRSTSQTGDFFSWCAVMRFADSLCPYPWRVPTTEDFAILHQNLGYTLPAPGTLVPFIAYTYTGTAGTTAAPEIDGTWGGARWTGHAGNLATTYSFYWSSTEVSGTHARGLTFYANRVLPQGDQVKPHGFALRCVRMYDCDIIHFTVDSATANQTVGSGQIIAPIAVELDTNTTGSATGLGIRWFSSTDTTTVISAPTGITFLNDTIRGSTTVSGSFIFEIFTTGHTVECGEATIRGTLTVTTVPMTNCNSDIPGWGAGPLGASFATTQTWTVGTQLWSDAVVATACEDRTTEFDGGAADWATPLNSNFNADCRNSVNNPNFSGHYFSWCAVMRFANELCPYPWRVPSTQDFVNLDIALGGDGTTRIGPAYVDDVAWYIGTTFGANGGLWGGSRFTGSSVLQDVESTFYWSSTEDDPALARALTLHEFLVGPHGSHEKAIGHALRCVRNATDDTIPCTNLPLTSHDTTTNQMLCGTLTITDIVYNATGITSAGISWFIVAGGDTTQIAPPAGITFAITPTELTISGTFTDSSSAVFIYQIHAMTDTSCLTASGTITVFDAVTPGVIGSAEGTILDICHGDIPAEFTNVTSATGGNPAVDAYQWQISTDSVAWSDIPLANDPTFQPGALTDTTWFRRMRLSDCGDTASNVITVNVNSLPPMPTAESVTGNSDCSGTNPNGIIVIADAGTGIQYSIDGINFDSIRTFTNVPTGLQTMFLRSPAGCISSDTVTVPGISGAPVLTGTMTVTPNDTICNPFGTGNIVITSSFTNLGASPTIQWSIVGTGDILGATDTVLTLTGSDIPTVTTTYRITVTNNETGCTDYFDQIITVINDAVITTQPTGDTICIGDTAVVLSVTVTSSTPAHTYQWQYSDDRITFNNIGGATLSSHTVPNSAASDLWYRVVISRPNAVCPPMYSDTVSVVVLTVPTIADVTDSVRCSEGTVVLSAITSPAGLQVRWFDVETGGTPVGTTVSGANWTTPNITDTTTFWAEAYNGFCVSVARSAVVAAVIPSHNITVQGGDTNQGLCQGAPIDPIRFYFSGEATGATITWTGPSGTTSAPEGLDATADSIVGTVALTAAPGVYDFTITTTPTDGVCSPAILTGSITIHALPQTVTVDATPECGFTILTASATLATGDTIFWQGTTSNGTSITRPSSLDTVTADGTYFYRVRSAEGCWGTQDSSIVTIVQPHTLELTGAVDTNFQNVGVDSTIVDIVYTLGGSADSVTIAWTGTADADTPPEGITVSFVMPTLTISGTPTTIGVYTYIITTVGNLLCTPASDTGTIMVGMRGCNNDPLPIVLDTAFFVTPQEWTVGPQTWSDAVRVPACQVRADNFDGGVAANFNADCRNATNGFQGTYFSWCMVMRFADVLCPSPWRVPDSADFARLHLSLGFSTIPAVNNSVFHNIDTASSTWNYTAYNAVNAPNSPWGGARWTAHTAILDYHSSAYWSASEFDPAQALALAFTASSVQPHATGPKNFGAALRCVRPSDCDAINIISEAGTLHQAVCNGDSILSVIFELDTTTLGTATTLAVHWWRVSLDGTDTVAMANPPVGITVDLVAGTITGATIEWGHFIYEILTADPTIGSGCDTTRVSGTIIVSSLSCPNCNSYVPGWGPDGLGIVTWGNTTNRNIEAGIVTIDGTGGRPTQVWSAAVFATACAKGNAVDLNPDPYFDGGVFGSFSADCRQSLHSYQQGRGAGITGDFFSWCAVVRYGDKLCPYPWRVPSRLDFEILHQNFGHPMPPAEGQLVAINPTGTYIGTAGTTALPQIGGLWQGARWTGRGDTTIISSTSTYWSSSFRTAQIGTQSHRLSFNIGNIWVNGGSRRDIGHAVRCVREYECDIIDFTVDSATANQTVGSGQIIAPVSVAFDLRTSGTATTTAIRWQRIDTIPGVGDAFTLDTIDVAMPTGLNYNGATHTLSGATTLAGRYIFEIFTTNHDTACNEATVRGTLTVTSVMMTGCNNVTPGWGDTLLGASFATSQTWLIPSVSNGAASQEWSDVVVAVACAERETFGGGAVGNFNADCRNSDGNTNFAGDYFSWCAVMRFADSLCPAPWRVPTREDFAQLHLNLGWTTVPGINVGVSLGITSAPDTWTYIADDAADSPNSRWGGARFTGFAGSPEVQDSRYWSFSENSDANAFFLYYTWSTVWPAFNNVKSVGMALRCVRDTVLPPGLVGDMSVTPSDTICTPSPTDTIVISPTFTGIGTSPIFQWSIAGGADLVGDTLQNLTITPIPDTTTTYRITVTNPETGLTAYFDQTISIFPAHTLVLTSAVATVSQSVAVDETISTIVYQLGGSATEATVTWIGTAYDTLPPAGITVTHRNDSIIFTGAPTQVGIYTYVITTVANTCPSVSDTGTIVVGMRGCNFDTPGWVRGNYTDLGLITWGNNSNTEIEVGATIIEGTGDRPDQVWSRTVFASSCNKGGTGNGSGFNSGVDGDFNADCRQSIPSVRNRNTSEMGDFFSWCAVMRFADTLCPYPWRVPTSEDFRQLHLNLGYPTLPAPNASVSLIANTYMGSAGSATYPQFAGDWRGARYTGHVQNLTGANSYYWSSTEASATEAYNLYFTASNVWPERIGTKGNGFAVRCVRNILVDTITTPELIGDINVYPGDTICSPFMGDSVVISPKFVGLGDNPTFVWSIVGDGATISTSQNLTLQGNDIPTVTTTYRITVTNTTSGLSAQFDQTITVLQEHTITRLSALATENQSVAVGVPITLIVYRLGGSATGATVTWTGTAHADTVPAGITVTHQNDSILIQGTPTMQGFYTYTITTLANHCSSASLTETIRVGMRGCNLNPPQFGDSLGIITWGNTSNANIEDEITTIAGTGGRPGQVWSGAVFATVCAKGNEWNANEFNGGTNGNFNADCRQSRHTYLQGRDSGITGDLFSWCAVMRFADVLCPGDWRVPTMADFVILHQNLGFNLPNVGWGVAHNNNYAYMPTAGTTVSPQVGGKWGGARFVGFSHNPGMSTSPYWSSTEINPNTARFLDFNGSTVWPQNSREKYVGFALRCVRGERAVMPPELIEMIVSPSDTICKGYAGPITIEAVLEEEGANPILQWSIVGDPAVIATTPILTLAGADVPTVTTTYRLSVHNQETNLTSYFEVTITVIEQMLTRTAGPAFQDVALNAPITDVVYTFGGVADSVMITWIGTADSLTPPDGIMVSDLTTSPITISGTSPAQFGIYTFVITTIGDACEPASDTVNIIVGMQGCNGNPLGFELGTPYFATTQTWTIPGTDDRPNQVWSDAVRTTECDNRTTFDGGTTDDFNADCRNVPGGNTFDGNFFSWCMVMRFSEQLCPYPWRVPTDEDFTNLHQNLGYTLPTPGATGSFGNNSYMGGGSEHNRGGTWGGARFTGSADHAENAHSHYWSSTGIDATNARALHFNPGQVTPQGSELKSEGFALRCVRHTVLPPRLVGYKTVDPYGDTICFPFTGGLIISPTFTHYGVNPDIQWGIVTGSTITDIAGATSKVLTLPQAPDTTTTYRITITNMQTGLTSYFNQAITVVSQTLTRTSAVGTINQSVAVDAAITNIVYAFGGVADSVRITWTGTADSTTPPDGITVSSFTTTPVTISGTPTEIGIFTYTITTVGDLCDPVSDTGTIVVGMRGCNFNTPNWGDSLGTITWGNVLNTNIESGTTTVLGTNSRPSQTWSGAVFATACAKGDATENDQFNGGVSNNLNADCRQTLFSVTNRSTSRTGDFFSWCAVMRFRDQFCPYPWRVPTTEDFAILHENLGLSLPAAQGAHVPLTPNTYIGTVGSAAAPQIGGAWHGARFTARVDNLTAAGSYYWSSTEVSGINARCLNFGGHNVWAERSNSKYFGFALRCVRDTAAPLLSCSNATPAFGAGMGAVSWGTIGNTNIEIGTSTVPGTGDRPAQTWSGHVFASNCQKPTFYGGSTGDYRADCRQAYTNLTGNHFSWCAVMRFASQLCPYPWRVPTTDDFAILHQNLGYTLPAIGNSTSHNNSGAFMPTVGSTANPQIGGIWGGARYTGYAGALASTETRYWSSTLHSASRAHFLRIHQAQVWPQDYYGKYNGFALRCVRNP